LGHWQQPPAARPNAALGTTTFPNAAVVTLATAASSSTASKRAARAVASSTNAQTSTATATVIATNAAGVHVH
tara:strand:+ start:2002 stop:2220 length:219 start_codon:yes stop_codon:yes gene_type:complete